MAGTGGDALGGRGAAATGAGSAVAEALSTGVAVLQELSRSALASGSAVVTSSAAAGASGRALEMDAELSWADRVSATTKKTPTTKLNAATTNTIVRPWPRRAAGRAGTVARAYSVSAT
jgi:hypothetical protein